MSFLSAAAAAAAGVDEDGLVCYVVREVLVGEEHERGVADCVLKGDWGQ